MNARLEKRYEKDREIFSGIGIKQKDQEIST
jgi:hypothetical protein